MSAIDAVERFVRAITSNKELRENATLAPLRKQLMKEPLEYFDHAAPAIAGKHQF